MSEFNEEFNLEDIATSPHVTDRKARVTSLDDGTINLWYRQKIRREGMIALVGITLTYKPEELENDGPVLINQKVEGSGFMKDEFFVQNNYWIEVRGLEIRTNRLLESYLTNTGDVLGPMIDLFEVIQGEVTSKLEGFENAPDLAFNQLFGYLRRAKEYKDATFMKFLDFFRCEDPGIPTKPNPTHTNPYPV